MIQFAYYARLGADDMQLCIECGQPTMHMGNTCIPCGKARQKLTTPAVQIAAPGDIDQRAIELLAAEYERDDLQEMADSLRMEPDVLFSSEQRALRAISAALRSQGQGEAAVDCPALT